MVFKTPYSDIRRSQGSGVTSKPKLPQKTLSSTGSSTISTSTGE